jgi:transposase
MAPSDPKAKHAALRQMGTFNPRAAGVRHPLFGSSEFFDSSDLLQVKYETLRALEQDGYSIAQAAREFGLSRPTIYQARREFGTGGLEGLLPAKRGPKRAHKLTAEIREFIDVQRGGEAGLRPRELAARVRKRFDVRLHPRTIEKALQAGAKRGRRPQP